MTDLPPTVVFVHGLWLHATSWAPWVERFQSEGYAAIAPGWPGEPETVESARRNPQAVARLGVDEVVRHYATILAPLEGPLVVIGHSVGGQVAQRLLAEGHASAAVAIDPAPIKGVVALAPSALRMVSIAMRNPANLRRAKSLTRRQFRYGFANAVSQREADMLYDAWTIPSPMRPLFQTATANLAPKSAVTVDTRTSSRGPLLLIAGSEDRTIPAPSVKSTRKLYAPSSAVTDYEELPNKGHSLTVDSGWPVVADTSVRWLKRQLT